MQKSVVRVLTHDLHVSNSLCIVFLNLIVCCMIIEIEKARSFILGENYSMPYDSRGCKISKGGPKVSIWALTT